MSASADPVLLRLCIVTEPARGTKVQMQCPTCDAEPALLVYRDFTTVTLICASCQHIWIADVKSHPALKSVKPLPSPNPLGR